MALNISKTPLGQALDNLKNTADTFIEKHYEHTLARDARRDTLELQQEFALDAELMKSTTTQDYAVGEDGKTDVQGTLTNTKERLDFKRDGRNLSINRNRCGGRN